VREREPLTRDNLGWLLAKASQRWNAGLETGFREAGFADVRPSFGSVLVPLYEEDGLRMSDLATRSGLSKQAMTTLVRAVETAGLVIRKRDARDRRAVRVSLSARGEELRPVAERVVSALDARTRSGLSAAELDGLFNGLRKVVDL
jgi:DNA-binding MarR family transcriptional regulator